MIDQKTIEKIKPTILKIKHLRPSESQMVLDVDKAMLFENFNLIFESKHAYYGVDENEIMVYRVAKKPVFLQAKAIIHSPGITKIETDLEALLEMQRKYNADIYETQDRYCIAFPGILWMATKETEQ